MKHAIDVEEEEKWKEKLAEYKEKMGIIDDSDPKSDDNSNIPIIDTIKQILVKPYFWVFSSILVFSPYGIEILKLIFQYFGGK